VDAFKARPVQHAVRLRLQRLCLLKGKGRRVAAGQECAVDFGSLPWVCRAGQEFRRMVTKARLIGIIGGASILTLFGGFWCIAALAFWPPRPIWGIPAASAGTLVLLVACIFRLTAIRKLPDRHDPAAAARGKRSGILFGIIFGLEGGLIALCSALLGRSGLGNWIPVEVALIVGVHFIPLARVFEVRLYYWTGGLSVFGILACLLIQAVGPRLLCVGIVMAGVLWLTTVLLLLQTRAVSS
jgi:hypothetical protein